MLNLKREQAEKALDKKIHYICIVEQKTCKKSRRAFSADLLKKLLEQSGRIFIFEGRDDYRKHRTRQAVFCDIKRVCKKFNLKINLSPHSLRKNYAVYLKQQGKSLNEVQKILNHENYLTTMLYFMADEMSNKYK